MKLLREMRIVQLGALAALGCMTLVLTACDTRQTHQDNREIRQQTADATRDVKQGAKELAGDTKVAAANAVNGVNAIAQGVKQGVGGDGKSSSDSSDLVDINSATTASIALLPGISLSKAHDIVKGRPYDDAHALVSRDLLTQAQYDRIAGWITAK